MLFKGLVSTAAILISLLMPMTVLSSEPIDSLERTSRSTAYEFEIIKEGDIVYSKGKSDGRFTLGTTNGKRIMYGFPVPNSTSHFVIKVNNEYASNNPKFAKKEKAVYLSGNQKIENKNGSVKLSSRMMFDSVLITQTLTPVDKNLKPVKEGEYGQYYHISYKIKNISGEQKEIALLSLIDVQLDDNDRAKIFTEKTKIEKEQVFLGASVPENILSYHSEEDKNGLAAEAIFKKAEATCPDELYIGEWGKFHSNVWQTTADGEPYGDSAFLLKWNSEPSNSGNSKTYSFYYGLPNKGEVKALAHKKGLKKKTLSLNYNVSGTYKLSPESKARIDSFLQNNDKISGALIEGYGDAPGTEQMNTRISELRVIWTKVYLKAKGISEASITARHYGEEHSDQSEEAARNGKIEDRKVKITFYIDDESAD